MALFKLQKEDHQYDVVICGGGLAGHTLARQLKLTYPDISILMIEKAAFPAPVAAHKVGESTAGIGGHYFIHTLQLEDYFTNSQFKKLGFRYFFGESMEDFSLRPELGISKYPLHQAVQIDRGVFENDLHAMNRLMGVEIINEASVKDIILRENDGLSRVIYEQRDTAQTIYARWVIDAMGRRRFLQKKLNLIRPPKNQYNAAWFRVKGRIDVEDFVTGSNRSWHQRMPSRIRYYATNHLMGRGYWVWIIPLSSGYTSLGIVTDENVHPFSSYNTYQKSLVWLKEKEPVLYEHIKDIEIVDFKLMRNYSYSSEQVFSDQGWACTGEAALFPDPFYSPGSNLIAFENSIISRMIGLDAENRLEKTDVDHYNLFVISQNDWLTYSIQSAYSYFWHEQIFAFSFIWDLSLDKASPFAHLINHSFLERDKYLEVQKAVDKLFPLLLAINNLFKDWEERTMGRFTYGYLDYYTIPFLNSFHNETAKPDAPLTQLVEEQSKRMEKLEELAQVIFFFALQDTMPEKLLLFANSMWINAWAISLKSENWEKDGLFTPASKPRDLTGVMRQFIALFKPKKQDQLLTLSGLLEPSQEQRESEKILTQFNF